MTYCCALRLDSGMIFASDSRTNAGVDHISTFRKMIVYEQPGDRVMVLLSAGNLSISQSVREILQIEELREAREDGEPGPPITIWNATSMFDAARVLGAAVRHVYDRDAEALKHAGLDFNVTFIFGGQVKGEGMRLFLVYSAGNFIEATTETPYFPMSGRRPQACLSDLARGAGTPPTWRDRGGGHRCDPDGGMGAFRPRAARVLEELSVQTSPERRVG